MRLPLPLALAVATSLLTAVSGSACAQTPDLEARYLAGRDLRRRNDDAGALAVFESIWNQTHAIRARAQMGVAEAGAGRWAVAESYLLEALAVADDPWMREVQDGRENRAWVEETLTRVRLRLGSLDIVCPTPGAAVFIEGRQVAALPLSRPLRVLADNDIVLEVRAPGRVAASRHTLVHPSAHVRVDINDLAPSDGPDRARPGWTSVSSGGVVRSPWFWTAIGAVVVGGVVAGVVFGTQSTDDPYSGNLSPGTVVVR
ncbi:MAG: hypothetical protein Q8S73_20290 [Deltaproteobacteria bacterium]|nr:hypothetical protein [Myxococcales bacterium]MDP3216459.1 hypothetical protein [Deltaproteobacteria bacterium]